MSSHRLDTSLTITTMPSLLKNCCNFAYICTKFKEFAFHDILLRCVHNAFKYVIFSDFDPLIRVGCTGCVMVWEISDVSQLRLSLAENVAWGDGSDLYHMLVNGINEVLVKFG